MSAEPITAGIVGISGYAGMEMARLLSRHAGFSLVWAASDRWGGQRLGNKMAIGSAVSELQVIGQADAPGRFGEVQVVFLCTPPDASIELAPRALKAGARVVDLSGGFRLAAGDYPRWYGFAHAAPEALAQAVYSLPEATGNQAAVRGARLVSNPGCYPTVSALPMVALLRAQVIERDGIIIDAKSGTTGAGRKATEAWSFSEINSDFRAYKVLNHQHTPEIELILALAGLGDVQVTFTPHLLPVRRGILATGYARLKRSKAGPDASATVQAALAAFAEGKPFVRVVAPEDVTLNAVVGTNLVLMGARADAGRGVVVVVSAEDNLVKGAAGQALQNANIMFGFPETMGLVELAGHAP